MSVESILAGLGLGEVLTGGVTAAQFGLVVGSVIAFASTLALMIMAGQAAGAARASKREAETLLRNAQDLVVEARQLSAHMERSTERTHAGDEKGRRPMRVSARQTTPEAEIEVLDLSEKDRAARELSARNLNAAKDGATVPQMKSGLRRRRR